jgi:2'-5' RNA ligase
MFAIMPPHSLALKIDDERKNFAEKYKCIKALKPPVHITLYEPFKYSYEIEDEIKGIQPWTERQKPFQVELKNFNFFRHSTSPVIYIDVVKNDALTLLHKTFIEQLKKYMPVEKHNSKYTPHFTIGYRDVPAAIFPEIMHEYSKRRFSASFEVSSIYFWKHDGKNWQIQNEFKMGLSSEPVQKALF